MTRGAISSDVTVPYSDNLLIPAIDPTRAAGTRNVRIPAAHLRGYRGLQVIPGGDTALFSTPEQFGAVGDGVSHPAGTHLGLTTLAQLRAYAGGRYSFATSLTTEIDTLAIQAALRAGGMVMGRPYAHYKINDTLILPAGHTSANFETCKLDCTGFTPPAQSTVELITNPTIDGSTGWTQGHLTPRTNVVFTGGAAVFTDPAPGTGASYGDFGQQVTLTPGKWTIRLLIEMTEGASNGRGGARYMNIGFRPNGVGEGTYEWPHPLSFGSVNPRGLTPDKWVKFDVEVTETTTAWLDIQGGNCSWKVKEVHINPFRMNYVVWATGDDAVGLGGKRFDASSWTGGDFIGPVAGGYTAYTGPELNCFLHKSFRGEGARCNMDRLFIYGFDVGISFSDQAFLHVLTNTNIGSCRTCLKFLAGSVNAGENFRLFGCIIFNSILGLHAEGGGEWNINGTSFDFNWQDLRLEKGAKLSMSGQHCEFHGSETQLRVTPSAGAWPNTVSSITGGTSGATARVIINRTGDTVPHLVIEVLSGTFVQGETVTSNLSHTATTVAPVDFALYRYDLRGGSYVDFHGEFLQSGGAHRGALHMFRLESVADTFSCRDWWAYGLTTASGVLCTGAGRFLSRNFLGPGNANLPPMIMENLASDIFAGNGKISGDGTMTDMGFGGSEDGIGLMFGAHSNSAPDSRGLVPWEQLVSVDNTVYRTAGAGSLKLEYNSVYTGGTELRIYVPVTTGDAVLWRHFWSKPDARDPITHGPYTSGSAPNDIKISTVAGSKIAVVRDAQAGGAATYGPLAGWTVTLAGVSGNPGGVSNATWNTTFTILNRADIRVDESTVIQRYEIELPSAAATSQDDVGGASIVTTYSQTGALLFVRQFWVQVIYYDSVGRPVLGNVSYQGEKNVVMPHAATSWTKHEMVTHYAEPAIPEDPPLVDRSANGRAPTWATHLMLVWNWQGVRDIDPTDPPPLYLTDLFGNRI